MTEDRTSHLALVDELLPNIRLPRPPQLIVLAYREPDPFGHRTVASYVNWRTGGEAHSFALCSPTAPFEALAIVRAYVANGSVSTALIVVADLPEQGPPAAAFIGVGAGGWAVGDGGVGSPDPARIAALRQVHDRNWSTAWSDLAELAAAPAGAAPRDVVLTWTGPQPCWCLLQPWPVD
jgi:hypothetical protein